VETSGGSAGNQITVSDNGSYQMALFPGMYDFYLVGQLNEYDNINNIQ